MIRARLVSLHARRVELILKAAGERAVLAAAIERTDAVAGWFNTASWLLAEAKRHPMLMSGFAAFLIALWPRRMLSWAMKAWYLRQAYKRGLALWQRIAPDAIRARP
jgi:hypothetical protein